MRAPLGWRADWDLDNVGGRFAPDVETQIRVEDAPKRPTAVRPTLHSSLAARTLPVNPLLVRSDVAPIVRVLAGGAASQDMPSLMRIAVSAQTIKTLDTSYHSDATPAADLRTVFPKSGSLERDVVILHARKRMDDAENPVHNIFTETFKNGGFDNFDPELRVGLGGALFGSLFSVPFTIAYARAHGRGVGIVLSGAVKGCVSGAAYMALVGASSQARGTNGDRADHVMAGGTLGYLLALYFNQGPRAADFSRHGFGIMKAMAVGASAGMLFFHSHNPWA